MNNFEKQLEKWNNGILRGAQAKLAKCLQVTTATVALWTTGKRRPSKGYIAKMAQLFNSTIADVQRLFMTPNHTSVSFTATTQTGVLCDSPGPDIYTVEPYTTLLTPTEKTVSLPVFTKVPTSYPLFRHTQVRAWWTIPQSEAKKARFLFVLPSDTDRERLLFIQPCNSWKAGKYMLGMGVKEYLLFRVKRTTNGLILETEDGDKFPAQHFSPIGVVTRQICQL
ncbi:helix-turn-helix transcriptional regulator [Candidatus Avelusimicrobium luingense]|uniref:helix-turn-helix transcriptional regulator n=1 Tax=Candidatus Avelusimicrobium luingense TaxID=3416211 RepID=UPI003D10EF3B